MREPVGECHPLAMIAYSESRPRWAQRKERGESECKSSFFSKVNTNATDESCCDAHTRTTTGDRKHHNRNVNANIVDGV